MSFEKVTLAEPTDFVPNLGNVANGGSTLTLALDGDWQEEKYNTMVAAGYRVIDRWTVETCWCGMNYTDRSTERHVERYGHIPSIENAATVKVTYKGIPIFSGIPRRASFVWWSAVEVPADRLEEIVAQLTAIRKMDGVHFEVHGNVIHTAPVFKQVPIPKEN